MLDQAGGVCFYDSEPVNLVFADDVEVYDQMTAVLDGEYEAYLVPDVFTLFDQAGAFGQAELPDIEITVQDGYVTKVFMYYHP